MEEYLSGRLPAFRRQSVCLSGRRHKRTLFHSPSQASAPELHLVGTKTTTKRQLNNLSSQVKTLDLSTPGGSSYSNLLMFPVIVPDYFVDNKTRKTFTSECSL
ncbi:hypothetical protein AMECASPLE_011217, partial [Ameca splendens]